MIRMSFTYPVSSNIKLSKWEPIRDGGNIIELTPDEGGRISRMRITVPAVPTKPPRDPEVPIERQAPDIMQPTVDFRASQQIEDYALSIEALVSTFIGTFVVDRGRWRMEWHVDNEDEAQLLRGSSVIDAFRKRTLGKDIEVAATTLSKLILERDRFKDMIVPFVFWSHGLRDMSEQHLIGAYYNFFFVLEVLFAPGYSSPKKVERLFLSSPELRESVDAVRARREKDILSAISLRRLLKTARCEATTEGVIRFLVKTRGRLHHANLPTSPAHWLPTHAERFSEEVRLVAAIVDKVLDIRIGKLTS
jgi:hypothetical protein